MLSHSLRVGLFDPIPFLIFNSRLKCYVSTIHNNAEVVRVGMALLFMLLDVLTHLHLILIMHCSARLESWLFWALVQSPLEVVNGWTIYAIFRILLFNR